MTPVFSVFSLSACRCFSPKLVNAGVLLILSACGGGSGSTSPAGTPGNTIATPATPNPAIALGTIGTPPIVDGNWVRCAGEGEVCFLPSQQQVRYGIAGKYTYRVAEESIPCNNSTFSDPSIGDIKTCEYAPLKGASPDGQVFAPASFGRTLSVGPHGNYALPCDALNVAAMGDIVEIDAAGTYDGNVCAFEVDDLTIRGVNGRPKIDATGQYAWGKGIWVVRGRRNVIENVELSGARVPDHNGAAIRLDGVHLTLRNSFIHDNENGILTNNDKVSDIVIEHCEFGHNGYGTGFTHNLYIGYVSSLTFRYNFSHDANVGHNLKSRAGVNTIVYNRFSSTRPGEPGSTEAGEPSYEIDLPNAGTAYVIGNIIEQPAANQNTNVVSYGVEGASNQGQMLYVINNTFINDAGSGSFVLTGSDVKQAAFLQNNVFVGPGDVANLALTILAGNYRVNSNAFVDFGRYDLLPAAGAAFIGAGALPRYSSTGVPLVPRAEYVHVAQGRQRSNGPTLDAGAYAAQ